MSAARLKAIAPSENAQTSIQSMVQRSERGNTAALTDCGNGMTAPLLWLPIYVQFPCLPGAKECLLPLFSQAFSPASSQPRQRAPAGGARRHLHPGLAVEHGFAIDRAVAGQPRAEFFRHQFRPHT